MSSHPASPGPGSGPGAALAWLAHPVTLLALLLLVVNDHVWKQAYPGLVTGKLSDVAGLIVAPPLVATVVLLLVPRLPGTVVAAVAVALTGAGFAAVQLSAPAASVASLAWSTLAGPSRLYADPTDLLALPALAVAWWLWRRSRARPVAHRLVRLARLLVVLPAALLAVGATSLYYPYASGVAEWDGGLVAGESNAMVADGTSSWYLSDDRGQSWRRATRDEQERVVDDLDAATAVRGQGCVSGDDRHCYRVVPGRLAVEESRDGGESWRISWEVTEQQREELVRRYPYLDDVDGELSSQALVVHATAEGHVVLVANGRDGFALRSADGQWHRLGFFSRGASLPHWDDPIRTTWAPYGLLWGLVAMLLATLIVTEVARRPGSRRWWRWFLIVPGALLIALGLSWLIGFNARTRESDGLEELIWLLFGGGTVGFGLLLWLAELLANRALSGRQVLVVAPGAILVGIVVGVMLRAGLAAHPAMIASSVLLFGITTTAVAALAWRTGRRGADPAP